METSFVIVGPGAVGCLFAGLLAEAGHTVCLLDHTPEHARRLSADGLRIEKDGLLRTVPVSATADPAIAGKADVLWVCVKAHDTARAMENVRRHVRPDTLCLTVQNGLGNVEAIADAGCRHILGGATTHGVTLLGPGHIRHAGEGDTVLAPAREDDLPAAEVLAALLTRAGIRAAARPTLLPALWSKLVINAAIGPVTALSGLPNGAILEAPEWRTLLREAAIEAADVAARKGIPLLFDDVEDAVESVCRRTARNISSMLQDVRAGRRTEIEAINGAIVREAQALNGTAPVNQELTERVLRRLETARRQRV